MGKIQHISGHDGFQFDLGIVAFSEVDSDGFLGLQFDLYGDDAGMPTAAVHHPFGFASRPMDPDPSGIGCQALYAWEGDEPHAFLGSDPRYNGANTYPNVKKGGSVQYCANGSFASFAGKAETGTTNPGSYTIYVPYQNASKAMCINIDVTTQNAESIAIVHGNGSAIILNAADNSVTLKSPSGACYIQITDSGIVFGGNVSFAGGVASAGPIPGKPLVQAPGLLAYLLALETIVGAKTPGAPFPTPSSAAVMLASSGITKTFSGA